MIRILHVDSERPWRGGQQQVLLLMRRQRSRGDEPHLVAPVGSALTERASKEGFTVHPLPMRGSWDLPSVFALARLMREERPDIVHWHAARAHAIGAMAALIAPGPARVLSRRVQFPVRRSLGSRLLYALPIERIAAISQAVQDALVRSGVDPGLIRIVPSGIDLASLSGPFDRSSARRRLGAGDQDVVALNVSAMAPRKGQNDLLHATALSIRRVPSLRVWIAGEGPLEEELRGEQRALGLEESVKFLGFRTDVFELLRAADFFCLPSLSEGLGTSILEAMAAGLPVVATRTGGVPEIVEEARTGILVPPSDPAALSDAMVRVASRADLRASMGALGRERAERFSADRTAQLTCEVYRSALAARGRLTV
ncbi:MAG TPA: glycosyltransferase [Candidatus Eisenbacteria bacterium]